MKLSNKCLESPENDEFRMMQSLVVEGYIPIPLHTLYDDMHDVLYSASIYFYTHTYHDPGKLYDAAWWFDYSGDSMTPSRPNMRTRHVFQLVEDYIRNKINKSKFILDITQLLRQANIKSDVWLENAPPVVKPLEMQVRLHESGTYQKLLKDSDGKPIQWTENTKENQWNGYVLQLLYDESSEKAPYHITAHLYKDGIIIRTIYFQNDHRYEKWSMDVTQAKQFIADFKIIGQMIADISDFIEDYLYTKEQFHSMVSEK